MLRILTVSIFLLAAYGSADAQSFKARFVLGVNGTQITGDDMAGFDKGGLWGGLGIDYPLNKKLYLGFDLLAVNKGSRREYDDEGNATELGTWHRLSTWYFEVPLRVRYRFTDNFSIHGGLAGGLLMSSTYEPDQFSGEAEQAFLDDYELSGIFGASYYFYKGLGATMRFSHSLSSIGKRPSNAADPTALTNTGLINVVSMFGLVYQL